TITTTTFPTLLPHESGWLWRTEQTFTQGSAHGDVRWQPSRIEYDENGDPSVTYGQLAGTVELDRSEPGDANAAPASSPIADTPVELLLGTTEYDAWGNPLVAQGANLRCSTVAYDATYRTLPTVETIYTQGCSVTP